MASNARVRPLRHSSVVVSARHTSRVSPLEYAGTAAAAVTSDTQHLCWITHPDNPAITATIATTSAASLYPASNLQLLPITACWRSVGVASAQDITLDFGADQSVDIIALVNHNMTSTATIAIAAGTTSAVSDFSTTVTWREFLAFKWLTSPETYRYWRIRITDTGNTQGFIEVGYPVAGLSTKPEFTFREGWVTSREYATSKIKSEFGVPTAEKLYERQRLEMPFGPLPSGYFLYIRRWYVQVKRNLYPALVLLERGGTDAYFGRIQSVLEEKIDQQHHYADIQFIEDSYGSVVGA